MDLNLFPDQTAATGGADPIIDVSEATFMAEVVDASMQVPVIVDFWAPWCGPCKQLMPALEAAVRAQKGAVKLAKINVDENQQIAAQMRVQSIPAVFAFVNGQPVDGFMGPQTPAQLDEFITRIVAQGGGAGGGLEEAVTAAHEMLSEGAVADAAQTFGAILQEEPENVQALAGMAKCYLAMDDMDQARAIMATVPEGLKEAPEIAAVLAELDLAAAAADMGELGELRAAVAADDNNYQARLDLALGLAGAGDTQAAIDELLELFRRDQEWNESAAKTQLIKIFEMLGPKDPMTQRGRRALSSIVFA